MPRFRPSVRPLLPALVLALAGCHGSGERAERTPVDPESIADAPMPAIKPETFLAAGDLATTRHDHRQAAFQYEQALKADPHHAEACRKLALAYVKADQLPAAITAWQRYVTLTKGSDDAYGSLGYACELAGRKADAEKAYQDGIKLHPDGRLCRINYGLMLVRKYDVDAAVKQMSVVLQPAEVNYNVASVYKELGRRDLAQFYYKRALECDPGFEPARQKLTMLD